MPFFDPIRIGASGAADTAYTVDRSLRFNDDDSAYLRKSDFGSSDSSTTFTFSAWIKRANLDVWVPIAGSHSGSNAFTVFGINPQNELVWRIRNSSSVDLTRIESENLLRDPSAWYHVLLERNSTLSSSSDRAKLYINGVRVTDFSQNTKDSQNLTYSSDFLTDINIGRFQRSSSTIDYGDFYLAEYHYIDGQAYDPSYFTETNSTTGQLIPKKYTGSYGTNGFYLNFSDNSGTSSTTLGKDSSGNGNNFTPNNFATNDAVKDSPTNNFCTFNPLSNYDNSTLSEGNLKVTGTGSDHSWQQVRGNMGVSSGKWYFEIRCNSIAANEGWIAGIHEVFGRDTEGYFWYSGGYTAAGYGYAYGVQDNNQRRTNGGSDDAFSSDVTAGKVVGFRLNLDDNEILISVDGVDKGKMYDIQSGITYSPAVNIYTTSSATLNCGQDSTFQGQESSGGNTDSGGIGDFAYAVPSGYKALCSANLPDPTILLPNNHFETLLYTGDGSSGRSITGLEFSPDWVWIKRRNSTHTHNLYDTVRGATKYLAASNTNIEYTESTWMTAFLSNGFEVGSGAAVNHSSSDFVAWNWDGGSTDGKTYAVTVVSDSGNKYRFDGFGTSAVTLDLAEGGTYVFDWSDSSAQSHPVRFSTTSDGTHGGGSEYTTGVVKDDSAYKTTITVAASAPTLYYYCQNHSGMGGQVNTNSTLGSSNFDGNNQSTVKVNATAGFSIVSYTGNGTNNSNVTMGHGLGVAPDAVILKNRDTSPYGSKEWVVWHQDVGTDSTYVYKNLTLNSAGAASANSDQFRTVDASTIQVRSPDSSNGKVNANNNKYIAYVFSEVAGYSKHGLYYGNSDDNGTFVFTGFRPAWLMVKRSNGSNTNWTILDNKRDAHNVTETRQFANDSDADSVSGGGVGSVDFVSNGFKVRDSHQDGNSDAGTYIYLCFAESPFKNARAR